MATGVLNIPVLPDNSTRSTRHVRRRQDLFQVEHYQNLTLSSHCFQFRASAVAQILPLLSIGKVSFEQPSNYLVSSPYVLQDHLLDLTRLPDVQDRILALALTQLKPTRPDYAMGDYETSLTWQDVQNSISYLSDAAHHSWQSRSYYVVIFRSKLKQDYDAPLLWELDRESHREAVESGGLLKYWFGSTDSENRNLATCVWRSREDARAGGTGPWHHKARAAGNLLYEHISFATWKLTISDGAESLKFEEWSH